MVRAYKASDQKKEIREFVYNFLKDCKSVITLPNLYFDLEAKLLKKSKVVCYEYDKNIYFQQQSLAPKKIQLELGNILSADTKSVDGMFLDFCGPFKEKMIPFLKEVNSGSKIAVTFLAARESLDVQKYITPQDRVNSYIRVFKKLGFKVYGYIPYISKSPMLVFFIIKN